MVSAQDSGLAHRKNSVSVSSLFPMQTPFRIKYASSAQ